MANRYMAKILLIRRKTRINQSMYMSSCVFKIIASFYGIRKPKVKIDFV